MILVVEAEPAEHISRLEMASSRDLMLEQLRFFRELGVSHLDTRPRVPRAEPADPTVHPDGGQASPATESPVIQDPMPQVLEAIRQEIGDCRRCALCGTRTQIVFGVGNPHADLMFVGEAPGADEDAQGIPFVGRAGQLLTRIIETMFDIPREKVYIANIIKCRPPGNRDPQPEEVAACQGFLFQQIEAVDPKVIVALGKYAAQTLLETEETISKLRGRFFEYRDRLLLPTFHPSFLLRNAAKKREVFVDMKAVRAKLEELGWHHDRQ